MRLDDWILALHLLSAFAMVGAMVLFSIAVVAMRSVDRPSGFLAFGPLLKIGNVAVIVGVLGTVVFGVWLAISLDRYSIFDFWVLAAIALWAVGSETGRRAGAEYDSAFKRAVELAAAGKDEPNAELAARFNGRRGRMLHVVSTAVILLVLLDMIWKPGA